MWTTKLNSFRRVKKIYDLLDHLRKFLGVEKAVSIHVKVKKINMFYQDI